MFPPFICCASCQLDSNLERRPSKEGLQGEVGRVPAPQGPHRLHQLSVHAARLHARQRIAGTCGGGALVMLQFAKQLNATCQRLQHMAISAYAKNHQSYSDVDSKQALSNFRT